MLILCKKKKIERNVDFFIKYKFFEEIEQFSGKGVNLVVNFGRNDNWF